MDGLDVSIWYTGMAKSPGKSLFIHSASGGLLLNTPWQYELRYELRLSF